MKGFTVMPPIRKRGYRTLRVPENRARFQWIPTDRTLDQAETKRYAVHLWR